MLSREDRGKDSEKTSALESEVTESPRQERKKDLLGAVKDKVTTGINKVKDTMGTLKRKDSKKNEKQEDSPKEEKTKEEKPQQDSKEENEPKQTYQEIMEQRRLANKEKMERMKMSKVFINCLKYDSLTNETFYYI